MDVLSEVPAFETFIRLVARNIQIVPEVKLDEKGFKHRIQIFDEPGSRPRVLFSKRALAGYKCRLDVLNHALANKSAEALCDAACLLVGKNLLLTNRFSGAALIAHAFTKFRASYMPDGDVFEYMLRGVREKNQAATVNFFQPLAHEIGHFERSQALSPTEIRSDKFFDTYRINYREIWPIIGDSDYLSCQKNDQKSFVLASFERRGHFRLVRGNRSLLFDLQHEFRIRNFV